MTESVFSPTLEMREEWPLPLPINRDARHSFFFFVPSLSNQAD